MVNMPLFEETKAGSPASSRGQVADSEWVVFPGGELEGRCPSAPVTCSHQPAPGRALCFQCYRASLERDRAVKQAGELNTATDERFAGVRPFAPVDRARLQMLKAERAASIAKAGPYVHRRRQAQIEARHALARLAAGVRARDLRLPESWLPFVRVS